MVISQMSVSLVMNPRWSGGWVPGGLVTSYGLDNGCQVDVRWSGYVSPSRANEDYMEVWCKSRF